MVDIHFAKKKNQVFYGRRPKEVFHRSLCRSLVLTSCQKLRFSENT